MQHKWMELAWTDLDLITKQRWLQNVIQKRNNEDNLFKNNMQILMDYFYLPC